MSCSMNYDLCESTEFFKFSPLPNVTPITNYIEEGSPFQRKLSMKTPKMKLICVDINQSIQSTQTKK